MNCDPALLLHRQRGEQICVSESMLKWHLESTAPCCCAQAKNAWILDKENKDLLA